MSELTVIVDGEIIDLRAEADQAYIAREEVIALKTGIDESFLALGERLYTISKRQWYRLYDCDTFDEYIDTLSMSRAWVFQLARIHSKYRIDLEVDDKRLAHIGVTKLAQLASRVTEGNMDHFLEVADESSISDLKRELGLLPEIGTGKQLDDNVQPGYYYLTPAHGDIALNLTMLSKRYVEVLTDEAGALIAKV